MRPIVRAISRGPYERDEANTTVVIVKIIHPPDTEILPGEHLFKGSYVDGMIVLDRDEAVDVTDRTKGCSHTAIVTDGQLWLFEDEK